MKYYTLFQRENNKWSPQYGSYIRRDCEDEAQDMRIHGTSSRDLRIITHEDSKESLEKVTEKLNSIPS